MPSTRLRAAVIALLVSASCGGGDGSGDAVDPGADQVVSGNTVGPEGGIIRTEDGISITVPGGAVLQETTIEVDVVSDPLGDAKWTLVGPLVRIGPSGTWFVKPVKLSLPVDQGLLPEGWELSDVRVWTRKELQSPWVYLGGQTEGDGVGVVIDHLSEFAPATGCAPDCAGRQCGDDGCGGLCGTCTDRDAEYDMKCDPTTFQCKCPSGRSCWLDPCCAEWEDACYLGKCCFRHCFPPFGCGPDGCGGSCGECGPYGTCTGVVTSFYGEKWNVCDCIHEKCDDDCCGPNEVCWAGACCTPDCEDRDCGDDGCGGSCGDCNDPLMTCKDGTCEWNFECGNDQCEEGENCSNCMSDCPCKDGEVCNDGKCCTPYCTGRQCGPDECGGDCGQCPEGSTCLEFNWHCLCEGTDKYACNGTCCESGQVCDSTTGKCCTPEDCASKECGSDGCGNWCKSCEAPNTKCDEQQGKCVCRYLQCGSECCPEMATCIGGKCSCPNIKCGDTCCSGAGDVCIGNYCCTPDCTDKECGNDGCGGSCGDCQEKPGTMCEENKCVPLVDCGDGMCLGLEDCGSCPEDCKCAAGAFCYQDKCCSPSCSTVGEPTCGTDGCGGSCGTCSGEGQYCNKGGVCECYSNGWPPCGAGFDSCCPKGQRCNPDTMECCIPDCESEKKECGDDGCGGQNTMCGVCAKPNQTCVDYMCQCDGDPCGEWCCPENAVCKDGKCECANVPCGGFCCDPGEICAPNKLCCKPDCTGRECGNGGCGLDSCGKCPDGQTCDSSGHCCTPDCKGWSCGNDGCGGSCGECNEGQECKVTGDGVACTCPDGRKACGADGKCCPASQVCNPVAGDCCTPACAGKECGDDGCGGKCGTCLDGYQCLEGDCVINPLCGDGECSTGTEDCANCSADCACPTDQVCFNGGCCLPNCLLKQCGEDGCGGSCGECVGGECVGGDCVFCTPICYDKECGDDGCGGTCNPGCTEGLTKCVGGVCECVIGVKCGGVCCGAGQVCLGGTCCTTDCDGKECGDDGCGAKCGGCGPGTDCVNGECVLAQQCGDGECEGLENCKSCESDCGCGKGQICHQGQCCTPDCTMKQCGPDGCGGTCGDCGAGECVDGDCVFCTPDCGGKECGGDGCGGTCNPGCETGQVCLGGTCCTPDCSDKECGDDDCGGECGKCDSGQHCNGGKCEEDAPGTWTDPTTGLTWQKAPGAEWSNLMLNEAKQYCAALDLAGGGWHLPNVFELRSLIRGCPLTELGGLCNAGTCMSWKCRYPSCDGCTKGDGPTAGGNCYWPEEMGGACSWAWSSSMSTDGYGAWVVIFGSGAVDIEGGTGKNYAICVR